jgi:hypothetical protein
MYIEQPELVKFSNEKVRICADSILQSYNTMKQFIEHYETLIETMPNTDEQIADGSHSAMGQFADGRKPITGAQVNQLKIDVENLISVFEMLDGEMKKRILNISVNGQARF